MEATIARPLRSVVIVALAFAFLYPQVAQAGETVIDFDGAGLSPGEDVTDEYAAQGVTFVPQGAPPNLPRIVEAANTQSAPRAARLFNCHGEFCENEVRGNFNDYLRTRVKVYVGGVGGTYFLTALLDNGGTRTNNVTAAGVGVTTPLEVVASAGTKIKGFTVTGPGSIDDLTFDAKDPGDPPDPPQFTLERDFSVNVDPSGTVGLAGGKSNKVKIVVSRFDFAGAIKFTLKEPLPSKVTHNFSPPSPYVGGDGGSITLNLNAEKNAPAAKKKMTIVAEPTDQGSGAPTRTLTFNLEVVGEYDLRVTGIEVTQGIQSEFIPCGSVDACDENISLPPRAEGQTAPVKYSGFIGGNSGVPLVQGKKAVARVYANLRIPAFPNGITVGNVGMKLYGFDGAGNQLGPPLLADAGEKSVSSGGPGDTVGGPGLPWVTFEDRATQGGGFTFTLPDDWTRKPSLRLRAEIVPPTLEFIGTTPTECNTAECKANNRFTLTGIRFYDTGYYSIATVRAHKLSQTIHGPGNTADPYPRKLHRLGDLWFPLEDGGLYYDERFWDGEILVDLIALSDASSRDKMYAVKDAVEDYADDTESGCERGNLCSDVVIGLFDKYISDAGVSNSNFPGQAVMYIKRPASIAHELSHNFGREHSGTCPSENGQGEGEDWPPDEKGFMQGVGLDTRAASGPGKAGYRVIAPTDYGAETGQPQYFDYQSYCRPDDKSRWTSVRGWKKDVALLQAVGFSEGRIKFPQPRWCGEIVELVQLFACGNRRRSRVRSAGTQASGPRLRVQGLVELSGAVKVTRVGPAKRPFQPAPQSSAYHLIVRNAGGGLVSDTPMKVALEKDELVSFLSAEVPAAGAASVEIRRNGTLVATRMRSAGVPTVKVTAPKEGKRADGGDFVNVKWQAFDPDGDRLSATVDYSADDGGSWRPIFAGPGNGSARILSSLLSGSKRARVRVRLNDGFNEAAGVSAQFVVKGRRPSVSIASPLRGQQLSNDASVYLSGVAHDDAHRRITGKRLRWFVGKRRLGSGAQISVTGLPAGKPRITLVAKDRNGRTGRASVKVRVKATKPDFLRLEKPATLAVTAKRVKLVVASFVPAKLRVRKQTFAVGRKPKQIRVKIKPGTKVLRLKLKLRAGGKSRSAVVVIPRGAATAVTRVVAR